MARLAKTIQPVKRGEIWVTDLRGGGKGWEIAKKRPALIISNNVFNKTSPTVVTIPISSQIPEVLGPERILIPKINSKLDKDPIILIGQIRAIDKSRLIKKIGKLSKRDLIRVEFAINLVLGLSGLE